MIRLAICVVASLVAHVVFERGLELLPPQDPRPPAQLVEIRVIEAPPPEVVPPPEPEPEPVKPPEPVTPPPEPAKPVATPHTPAPSTPSVHPAQISPVAKDAPAPDHPAVTTDTQDERVFGVDMSSTSQVGTGPAMSVGNTHTPAPTGGSAGTPVKPLPAGGAPIAAFEATKMPLPQGRCFGKYTPEATAAGTEGTVVLDLTVGEDGRTRDIVATDTLPNGLTASAIAALRACVFTPGEKDGHAVPVRIRGFKIKFVLQEAAP